LSSSTQQHTKVDRKECVQSNMFSFRNVVVFAIVGSVCAFVPTSSSSARLSTDLKMGLFDNFKTGGSGRDRLDEEWEKQQEILKNRRKPQAERNAYFKKVEERRQVRLARSRVYMVT